VAQVAAGKPVTMFIEGEYGIGKSSIAAFTQWRAETEFGLHGIYVSLGGVTRLSDVPERILSATVRSGAFEPMKAEKIREWLAKYVGQQQLFGLSLNFEALKKDAPNLGSVSNLLEFLGQVIFRLKETGVKGVFLILDEINGITGDPDFAHFLKGLVDTNALARPPVPLLLMLCGVEERRHRLVEHHEPVGRVFDVIKIDRMTDSEMREFYSNSFGSAGMTVDKAAMDIMVEFAAGFPKIMHLIGNAAYWIDTDRVIDRADALNAVVTAADEVGRKYVDQQVYRALRSKDYRSILRKIAAMSAVQMSFKRKDISGLSEAESRKLDNFLRKMKKLRVLRQGDVQGEYVFNHRMVRLYIWMQSKAGTGSN